MVTVYILTSQIEHIRVIFHVNHEAPFQYSVPIEWVSSDSNYSFYFIPQLSHVLFFLPSYHRLYSITGYLLSSSLTHVLSLGSEIRALSPPLLEWVSEETLFGISCHITCFFSSSGSYSILPHDSLADPFPFPFSVLFLLDTIFAFHFFSQF